MDRVRSAPAVKGNCGGGAGERGGFTAARRCAPTSIGGMHLRPPSFDHGTVSGLWGIGLGLLILLGSLALGVDAGTAFIIAGLAAAAIFIYVRLYGEEELRR
jgi:hypothetical protein